GLSGRLLQSGSRSWDSRSDSSSGDRDRGWNQAAKIETIVGRDGAVDPPSTAPKRYRISLLIMDGYQLEKGTKQVRMVLWRSRPCCGPSLWRYSWRQKKMERRSDSHCDSRSRTAERKRRCQRCRNLSWFCGACTHFQSVLSSEWKSKIQDGCRILVSMDTG